MNDSFIVPCGVLFVAQKSEIVMFLYAQMKYSESQF